AEQISGHGRARGRRRPDAARGCGAPNGPGSRAGAALGHEPGRGLVARRRGIYTRRNRSYDGPNRKLFQITVSSRARSASPVVRRGGSGMTHLSVEQLVALREPGLEPQVQGWREHVERCPLCRTELERLEQRVARLKALPTLRPGRDQFFAIQAKA